jgi:hypothetical protein
MTSIDSVAEKVADVASAERKLLCGRKADNPGVLSAATPSCRAAEMDLCLHFKTETPPVA